MSSIRLHSYKVPTTTFIKLFFCDVSIAPLFTAIQKSIDLMKTCKQSSYAQLRNGTVCNLLVSLSSLTFVLFPILSVSYAQFLLGIFWLSWQITSKRLLFAIQMSQTDSLDPFWIDSPVEHICAQSFYHVQFSCSHLKPLLRGLLNNSDQLLSWIEGCRADSLQMGMWH